MFMSFRNKTNRSVIEDRERGAAPVLTKGNATTLITFS